MTFQSLSKLSERDPNRIYMFIVGGCGEFGMNLTIYAHKGQTYVVDCGLSFAETYEIGVDARIPDISQLESILGGPPTAYLITHGHEDHIGALPYFLERWPAPVYIGPWALELVREKLLQLKNNKPYTFHEVRAGQTIRLAEMNVHWVHVPHSIPFCCSLLLEAGPHRVFHTGDFKLNGFTPYEASLNLENLKALAAQAPILALVSDSTNASANGHCPSENIVRPALTEVIARAEGVSFVTTFSSNLWRLQTVLLIACELKKKVLIFGAGMRRGMEIAGRLKLLGDEAACLVDEEGSRKVDRKDLIILCSGCQGEYKSGLKRIVFDEVAFMQAKEGDQVIFSSRVIPGNEKPLAKLMSMCAFKGIATITAKEFPGIHVSGHAYSEDLKSVMDALQPTYTIPVHGTFIQLDANKNLTTKPTIDVANGQITAMNAEGVEVIANHDLNLLFIDSWSRRPMTYDTMRERHKIGDSGLAVVTGIIQNDNLDIDIDFIGLPFDSDDDADSIKNRMQNELRGLVRNLRASNDFSFDSFNERSRLTVRRTLSDRFIKKPVVISKVMILGEATHGLAARK
ncbi:MAG: ribonuclease J [Chitinophagaceae bacterium]|nr:ribonuclease J [Oligoflexus sp.]